MADRHARLRISRCAAIALVALFALCGAANEIVLERVGNLTHPAIREASGIAKSRRFPGIYWVHNDSVNAATLFAVKRDGSLLQSFAVKVPNIDWEDVALDDAGHIYLGDIGNNDLRLPLRAIYRLDEPDPSEEEERLLEAGTASYYRFPAGGRFDAEGLFIDRGRAVVVAKYLDGRQAELFAVRLDPPAPLIRPALPEPLGHLAGCKEPVTGASLAPEGRRLAVCSYHVVRIYERNDVQKDEWKPRGFVGFDGGDEQIEAITWDGADLILAGESRGLFRIVAKQWQAQSGVDGPDRVPPGAP